MTQSLTEPSNIILVGPISARIKFDLSLSQWLYSDPRFNVTATAKASQKSYALGKHNWTVTGDKCSEGNDYTLEMKLTGCNNTQFTCDDGECVKMVERCNQLPNCRDKSDEYGCKILALERGFDKRVPPVSVNIGKVTTMRPVKVNVSSTLLKFVAIDNNSSLLQSTQVL